MTEEEASTAIGVDVPQLIRWESGWSIPSVEQAAKMAEVYGLSMDMISFQKCDNKSKYDTTYLRAKILEKYNTLDEFAEAVEMKPQTIKSRLTKHTEFTMDEMKRIGAALKVRGTEIKRMFFTPADQKVRNTASVWMMFAEKLTDDEMDLLIKVMDLVIGRPDRREFAEK